MAYSDIETNFYNKSFELSRQYGVITKMITESVDESVIIENYKVLVDKINEAYDSRIQFSTWVILSDPHSLLYATSELLYDMIELLIKFNYGQRIVDMVSSDRQTLVSNAKHIEKQVEGIIELCEEMKRNFERKLTVRHHI